MICKKSGTYFKLHGYAKSHSKFNGDVCYYHNEHTNRKDLGKSTMELLIDSRYACDMVIPFLKYKIYEIYNISDT